MRDKRSHNRESLSLLKFMQLKLVISVIIYLEVLVMLFGFMTKQKA